MIQICSPRSVANGRDAATYTYETVASALEALNARAQARDGSTYTWQAIADRDSPTEHDEPSRAHDHELITRGMSADEPALWQHDFDEAGEPYYPLVTTEPLRALLTLANAELDDPNLTIELADGTRYHRVPKDRWQHGDDSARRWSLYDPVPLFARP